MREHNNPFDAAFEPETYMASPNANTFADLSRRYCDIIESRSGVTPGQLLVAVQPVLMHLCLAAWELSCNTTCDDDDSDLGSQFLVENIDATIARLETLKGTNVDNSAVLCGMTLGEWWTLFQDLQKQLRGLSFWTPSFVLEQSEPSAEAESFADGLADIYRDLRWGLSKWNNPGANDRVEAVALWNYSFRKHWGTHALDVIRAIHALSHEGPEDSQESAV